MNKDRRVLAREMGKLIKKWEKSGLTQRDFVKGEAVSLSKFKYWLKKTKSKPTKPIQTTSSVFKPISFSDPACIGHYLYYKRLEEGTFQVPYQNLKTGSIKLSYVQLAMLIDGISIKNLVHSRRFSSIQKWIKS